MEDHHWWGFIIAMFAVRYGLVAIALKLAGLPYVPGYASLLVTIAFLSGVRRDRLPDRLAVKIGESWPNDGVI